MRVDSVDGNTLVGWVQESCGRQLDTLLHILVPHILGLFVPVGQEQGIHIAGEVAYEIECKILLMYLTF